MKTRGWRPGWDGHLLLFYDEESQRRAGVATWVHRGLKLGSKILCTQPPDDPPDRSLPGLFRDEPDVLEAMERGQIQVIPADALTYDPDFIETIVDEALSEGYPSVRWTGDATTAWDVIPRSRHELVERATDELCTSRPLSVKCEHTRHSSAVTRSGSSASRTAEGCGSSCSTPRRWRAVWRWPASWTPRTSGS